jgi:hypothetical protein
MSAAKEYECCKVVHTLVETTLDTTPGAGVGSTIVEYWPNNCRSISPLKVENYLSYIGNETQIIIDADPMPLS